MHAKTVKDYLFYEGGLPRLMTATGAERYASTDIDCCEATSFGGGLD